MRRRRLVLSFMVFALAVMTASVSMAAKTTAQGWHMGANWQQNSFSGSGVVSSIDTSAPTITVNLNGTSRLISSLYGQTYTFTLDPNAKVAALVNGGMGYNNMMVNSSFMNSNSGSSSSNGGGGGMMGGASMGGGRMSKGQNLTGTMGNSLGGSLTLSDIQANDNVQLLGYQDSNGNYIVNLILVWLY